MGSEDSKNRPRIGVVGLGSMGLPIARHISSGGCSLGGCEVRGWDVAEPRRAAAARAGIQCTDGLADLAAWTDRVFLILRDEHQLQDLIESSAGVLLPRGSVTVMSTVGPPFMEQLETQLAPQGIDLIDAPILSGNDRDAVAGQLDIVVSGPEPVATEIASVLQACGTVTLVGSTPGTAQAAKLTCQIMQAAGIVASLEGLEYAASHGLDEVTLVPLLQRGSARSWALDNLERVRQMWTQPGDPFALIHKDLLTVLDDGKPRNLDLLLTAELAEQFRREPPQLEH